jgi:hypothetical protein
VRVLLLAALVLAMSPGAASAFSKAIWGDAYHNGVDQFPMYKQLGVSIDETTLQWSSVAARRPTQATNPSDPAYQWPAAIDQAVAGAKRFHMRVLLQVIGTPAWANGNRPWNWVPTHPSDYAAFVTAAARRYPAVHLWMVWGEPNREGLFAPMYGAKPYTRLSRKQQIAPHNYARLLDAAYGALKGADRRNTVIGGSTYTTGLIDTQQWIQNLRLPNGHRPRMDMYAQNPFTFREPSTLSGPPSPLGAVEFPDLKRLAGWVDRNLRRGMPLFFSEWTVPTCPDEEFNQYVDPPVAARWVSEGLRLLRHWNRAYGLGWIHVYDDLPSSCGGLLSASGKRKPLFEAFARG